MRWSETVGKFSRKRLAKDWSYEPSEPREVGFMSEERRNSCAPGGRHICRDSESKEVRTTWSYSFRQVTAEIKLLRLR